MKDYTELEDGTLGRYLRQVRTTKGISVKELSMTTGVPEISIYCCENNKYTPTVYNLARICERLDIPFNKVSDIVLGRSA